MGSGFVPIARRGRLVGNQEFKNSFSSDTPENLQTRDYIDIASVLLDAAAAALAIAVVSRMTSRKGARARTLAAVPQPLATQPDSF